MKEQDRLTSTQELPTANVEGFAKFIMEDRDGALTTSHLHTIFGMRQMQMIRGGIIPSKEGLTPKEVEYYQGKAYGAADAVSQLLGIDEMGDWAANFDAQDDAEEFIEEVADQFEQVLIGNLEGVNNG